MTKVTNEMKQDKASLEVSSDQLRQELIEIRERLEALETIASISNKKEVEQYVRGHLKSENAKALMKACANKVTRETLIAELGYNNRQALDYHLTPLREADLVQQQHGASGTQTFTWSKLFRGLPKLVINDILNSTGSAKKNGAKGK